MFKDARYGVLQDLGLAKRKQQQSMRKTNLRLDAFFVSCWEVLASMWASGLEQILKQKPLRKVSQRRLRKKTAEEAMWPSIKWSGTTLFGSYTPTRSKESSSEMVAGCQHIFSTKATRA